ncbi:hypothetical protein [Paenibacillus xylaniclasticus]|uniref:hypothetical protein n=1 Tax=Paenibacillus xylaniclasticus TaxID=588083 RepID=UPI000FDB52BE|nr:MULTISPECIES: hypothetical protein [Paenibacillus]GFN34092.1 hypothetical protein PCURB6_43520 [Paenibacillus curdlanolyticus]
MGKMDEVIIVVPREQLFQGEELSFQGVQRDPAAVAALDRIIAENYTTMRRGDAEDNEAYKQPIPYCVIRRGNEIYMYRRLGGGGEARLHDKLSIGAGGHMNDIDRAESFQEVLRINLERELEEELSIESRSREFTTIGFINDDDNEVGKVHIGLLVILDIEEGGTVEVRETDQLQGEWISAQGLLHEDIYEKLETWSQIAAKVLV